MRIYLDNCCYNRHHDKKCNHIFQNAPSLTTKNPFGEVSEGFFIDCKKFFPKSLMNLDFIRLYKQGGSFDTARVPNTSSST